jgi:hypothetical protein
VASIALARRTNTADSFTTELVVTGDALVPARDRCLPVHDVLASMLPDAGLPRGRVIGCGGPAGWSLALALAASAVEAGAWLAVVGAPTIGLEAAGELGIALERVVLIDADHGKPSVWAERVAAAADGFELIVTAPPVGAERVVRRVRQRMQARGVVLLTVTQHVACDLEFATSEVMWKGIGDGNGRLVARRVVVELTGRRIPRPVRHTLLLPGPSGAIERAGDLL